MENSLSVVICIFWVKWCKCLNKFDMNWKWKHLIESYFHYQFKKRFNHTRKSIKRGFTITHQQTCMMQAYMRKLCSWYRIHKAICFFIFLAASYLICIATSKLEGMNVTVIKSLPSFHQVIKCSSNTYLQPCHQKHDDQQTTLSST